MKIPAGESICLSCYIGGVRSYVITVKQIGGGEIYTLYKVLGNDYERLGRGPSPSELEAKHEVWNAVKGNS